MENDERDEENCKNLHKEKNTTKVKLFNDIMNDSNRNIIQINNELKNKNNSKENIYYIPICRYKGCEGQLSISIDEDKFCINGVCQKNKEHIFNNIYFETVERFYLKDNIMKTCFKCSKNLESKNIYECVECENMYCSECFMSDFHIKKNKRNLKLIINKCPNDENILVNYCLNCNEKICLICLKKDKENNPHKNHEIINILNNMPSKNQLNNLKKKIIKKSDAFNSLIKSLTEWQKSLNQKIERIKENLKNELNIIKKLFFNFNIDYLDYTYYSNFNKFYKEIDVLNNKYLKLFMKANNFDKKTKVIISYLTHKDEEHEIITKKGKLKKSNIYIDWFTLGKITENISFLFDKKPKFYVYDINKINLNEVILGINLSPNKKKIYAYLENKKSIYILNYDFEKNILELTDERIEISESGHFNDCIHINNNCLLVIDDESLYLFKKNNINFKKFTNTNKVTFVEKIFSICKADNKYALIKQKSKLKFINIENLKINKIINNIDCLEDYSNLIPIKDCILVNCKKGISIISIRTKEMIQYIFDNENLGNKTIKSYNDHIYILNNLGCLFKYSFYEYNLILNEKIDIEKPDDYDFSFENMNQSIKKDNIYLYDSKIYVLEK